MAQKSIEEIDGKIFVNGEPVIRVTDVLVQSGIVDPSFFTEYGRSRGTAVHQACFLDLFGDLHVDSLHQVIKPFLAGWFLFKQQLNFRPILELCEKRLYHPIHDYVGRPDIACFLNNRPAVIDIKSGSDGAAKYQLAAYREFPELAAYQMDRFSLVLTKEGKYKLKPYTDPGDWLVFLDALRKVREL